MTTCLNPRYRQTGAYLLEALIGILIFALGVLGIVGLQAASLRTSTDNSLRAEAVFAASQLMGQMWTDVEGNLVTNYSSAAAGATYTSWAADLKAAQGGAWYQDPDVDFANPLCNAPPSPTSSSVYIKIVWKSSDGTPHNYATCGLIGQNLT
jgi:type IV pilus assembly protein PilV